MGKIYYMMGKSASGKDTIYSRVKEELKLPTVVLYTTRPIRDGEIDGVNYHFVDDGKVDELRNAGKIIELRDYQTVHGSWKYFTADDGQIDLAASDYLMIGTIESFVKMKEYFGEEVMVPLYIEVETGERLQRALNRERLPQNRKFEEMCRRFLADEKDFSDEKLAQAGIARRFQNVELDACVAEIVRCIAENR